MPRRVRGVGEGALGCCETDCVVSVAKWLYLLGPSGFGVLDGWRAPRAIVNLPNSITLSRIAAVPLLIWVLSPQFPGQGLHGEQEIIASAVFILASVTDGVDGYLARRRGQITTLGMLLDPLADKLMVTAAFILLVEYTPSVMKPWIAVLVIGREFLVTGL